MSSTNDTKLTTEQITELVKLYSEEGYSYKKLGELFGIGSTTARSYVVKSGVPRRAAYNNATGGKLTPEQEQEVIRLYKELESFEKVEIQLNLKPGIARRTIVKHNIPIRKCGGKPKYNILRENRICKMYQDGGTLEELGRFFYMHPTSILMILRRHGVQTRPTKEPLYHRKELFFDIINTEHKAYFFGMLYADGNVARDSPSIVLSLQEEDRYLVEELNALVSNDRPVLERPYDGNPNHKRQWGLTIYSQHMKDVLIGYGMVPAKSLIKEYPTVMKVSCEDIQRHFIRGYFDGNGNVSERPRKYYGIMYSDTVFKHTVVITSTLNMCEEIQKTINAFCPGVTSHIYKPNKKSDVNTYTFVIQGVNNTGKFLKWLYKDSTIYMQRKKVIADSIISKYSP